MITSVAFSFGTNQDYAFWKILSSELTSKKGEKLNISSRTNNTLLLLLVLHAKAYGFLQPQERNTFARAS